MNTQVDELPINELDQELASTIEEGLTLPAHWYTDPAIYDLEQARIHKHSWRFVTHTDRLKDAGDCVRDTVCDVPVVLVKDNDGEIRGFVNICAHRGSEVVYEDGNHRLLVCPFHGWTYQLDGKLRGAPRSDREPEFDKGKYALQPVRVDTWGPLVFVNLDMDAQSYAETYADFISVAKRVGLDLSEWSFGERFEQIWACNWKVLNENSMECYHCLTTHPELSQVLDVGPDEYQMEAYRNYYYHLAPCTDAYKKEKGDNAEPWRLHHFLPSFLIFTGAPTENLAFGLNKIPAGPNQTRAVIEVWKAPGTPDEEVQQAVQEWEYVLGQDRARTESVQRGVQSGRYRQGTLMLDSEYLIQHYQKRLRDELFGESV